MDEASLYIVLQGAVERAKGAATWTDVSLAIKRAKEAKVREQLHAIFQDFSLADLATAEGLADKEVFKAPHPLPAAKPSLPPPPSKQKAK